MTSAATPDVASLYRERGLGGALPFGQRPAVVVVDLINGFTDPAFPAGSNLDDVVKATVRLLDEARCLKLPIIHTTIAYTPAMQVENVWLQKMPAMKGLLEGSHWVALDERLKARDDEMLLTKRGASAFFGTDLSAHLAARSVDTVLVCGATTSGCIRATVVDGCMAGYRCFVPRECVGDRAAAPHEANLFDIQAKYGEVTSLEAVLGTLAQREVTA